MKQLSIYSCIVLLIIACTSYNVENPYTPEMFSVINDSLGKKLVSQCSRPSPKYDASAFFNLTESDQKTLHQYFKNIYQLKFNPENSTSLQVENLDLYIYQYVGVVIHNEKYVYINAFPKELIELTNHDWKRIPLIGCDGGIHQWGVLFNINNTTFSKLAMSSPY